MRNKCMLCEDMTGSEFLPVVTYQNENRFVQPDKLYNYAWGKDDSFFLLINGKRYEAQSIDFDFYTPKSLALKRIIEVDGDRMTVDEFLKLNHFDRHVNDRLSIHDLKDLFSLNVGQSMFIHLSKIERIF